MKSISATLAVLMMTAFAAYPSTETAAPQYPAWLEMKPGYAEACINGGGCIPMTQAELQSLAAQVMQRTMQSCRRGMTI